jgi:hypothetical protein
MACTDEISSMLPLHPRFPTIVRPQFTRRLDGRNERTLIFIGHLASIDNYLTKTNNS